MGTKGENEGTWGDRGKKYGFNKDYKLDPTDRWTDGNRVGF